MTEFTLIDGNGIPWGRGDAPNPLDQSGFGLSPVIGSPDVDIAGLPIGSINVPLNGSFVLNLPEHSLVSIGDASTSVDSTGSVEITMESAGTWLLLVKPPFPYREWRNTVVVS